MQQLTIKIVDLVNSPRKTQRIMRNATIPHMILKDFVDAANLMSERGFLIGCLSEISLRASGGKLLITPRESGPGRLSEENLLTVAIGHEAADEHLSLPRHIDWHRAIYANSAANCAALCQPVFASLAAARMRKPAEDVLLDAAEILKMTQCVKSTDIDLDENMEDEGILLIQAVGVLAWDKDLDAVLARIDTLERVCEIMVRSEK